MAKLNWVAIHESFWSSSVMSCGKNAWILAIYLITKARKKPSNHQGNPLPRGSVFFSQRKLAKRLKMTHDEMRAAIAQLESCSFITHQTTHLGTTVYLEKFDFYQPPFPTVNPTTTPHLPHTYPTPSPDKFEQKEKEKENKKEYTSHFEVSKSKDEEFKRKAKELGLANPLN